MDMTFNRRDFLKSTAAVAAVLPTFRVLSQSSKPIGPDDDQINVAAVSYTHLTLPTILRV